MSDFENHQMKPLARNLRPPPPPKFADNNVLRFKMNVAQCKSPQKARIVSYESADAIEFSVQLVEADKDLANLNDRLKRVAQLKSLNPSAATTMGMACLVRLADGLFRAAIVKSPQRKTEDYIVNLVDHGTTASVKIDNLHVIPTELVNDFFTFALPCRLVGVEKSTQVSYRELCAFFKCLTNNRIVTIKNAQYEGELMTYLCDH
jgi:hypothetical protein